VFFDEYVVTILHLEEITMSRLPKLRKTRVEIIGQIASLEEKRRGSVIRQFVKLKTENKDVFVDDLAIRRHMIPVHPPTSPAPATPLFPLVEEI
jgi:hypothetical protein